MAGMIATPALAKWPREYAVRPEPPTKRAKVYPQYHHHQHPYNPYAYDAGRHFKPLKRVVTGPAGVYEEVYGAYKPPVPTPPPSISVLHDTQSIGDGRTQLAFESDLDAPIRTKGTLGPRAMHFCGAVTFLWFSMWPTAKTYLSNHELSPGTNEELRARPEFVKYTRSLIEKADVSLEILTLSLLFLYRFRDIQAKQAQQTPMDRHPTSEARVLVVALMTANKLLDDISYTTATWSKMSGIDLHELKRMEMEFLVGLEFNLYVPAKQWAAWEQMVAAKLYPTVDSLARCAS